MTAMTADGYVYRYGAGDDNQPISCPVGATQQLYYGEVALQSGSGSVTVGMLKNGATFGSSDLVVGMVGDPAGGTYVKTGPGILGGSTDGAVWVDVYKGAFFFQSGSGADQLSAATSGKTVYYGGENASGPIACATSNSGARPSLGVQIPQDPGIAGGFSPGAAYWPITVAPTLGTP
jgi:hypothetical protein